MMLKRQLAAVLARLPKQTPKRFMLFLVFFCVYSIWLYPSDDDNPEELAEEALQNVAADLRYAEVYRKEAYLPKDLKHVLLWTDFEYSPFYYLGKGQKNLIKYNCPIINCYFTTDRKFFGDDLTKFDAIAFNGRNLKSLRIHDFPKTRSTHQKYIYVNTESAYNFPVCDKRYDAFFNWTATYRLDSEISLPYVLIKNAVGDIVGPKIDIKWPDFDEKIDEELEKRLRKKTKAAAWFVSNCVSKNKRERFASKLRHFLSMLNETVDVYGRCGPLKCPRYRQSECNAILQSDYYFYLSLENSFVEDYVSEKLLTAVQHDVVPIVYGGANYSRFLPPGSYINARELDVRQLAQLLYRLIHNPGLYKQFFKWKNHYSYQDGSGNYGCSVCQALNNKTLFDKHSSYDNFRKWWNPKDIEQCKPWYLSMVKPFG